VAYFFSPFRNAYTSSSQDCAFCDQEKVSLQAVRYESGALFENDHYVWLVNFYPKFEGHTMIVPKRHLESVYDETSMETLARNELTLKAITALKALYPDSGIELFIQFGQGSASSVKHLHWHIVPAHKDDELRSFEKLGHFYTTEEGKEKVVLFPHPIRLAKEELRDVLSQLANKHSGGIS
jgi:diadenosine tetraphosphate (Ap4A) HIT family hydrolase